jgi:hypothetical protein
VLSNFTLVKMHNSYYVIFFVLILANKSEPGALAYIRASQKNPVPSISSPVKEHVTVALPRGIYPGSHDRVHVVPAGLGGKQSSMMM